MGGDTSVLLLILGFETADLPGLSCVPVQVMVMWVFDAGSVMLSTRGPFCLLARWFWEHCSEFVVPTSAFACSVLGGGALWSGGPAANPTRLLFPGVSRSAALSASLLIGNGSGAGGAILTLLISRKYNRQKAFFDYSRLASAARLAGVNAPEG